MYAIVFDLDLDILEDTGKDLDNVEKDITKILVKHGFAHQQSGLYFGEVDAVTCVLAVMDLAKQHPVFAQSVFDLRMLRIEENNDLMPAVFKAINT